MMYILLSRLCSRSHCILVMRRVCLLRQLYRGFKIPRDRRWLGLTWLDRGLQTPLSGCKSSPCPTFNHCNLVSMAQKHRLIPTFDGKNLHIEQYPMEYVRLIATTCFEHCSNSFICFCLNTLLRSIQDC